MKTEDLVEVLRDARSEVIQRLLVLKEVCEDYYTSGGTRALRVKDRSVDLLGFNRSLDPWHPIKLDVVWEEWRIMTRVANYGMNIRVSEYTDATTLYMDINDLITYIEHREEIVGAIEHACALMKKAGSDEK